MVLHLPIGLLVGAFLLELLGMFRRSKGYDIAATWTLFLGTGAAALTIAFGLFLEETSKAGDYDALTMSWHKWMGIAMGALALIATITKIISNRKQWKDDTRGPGGIPLLLARLSLLGIAALLPAVGHIGGNMTHGNTYVFEKSPIDAPDAIIYFPHDPPPPVEAGTGLTARWNTEVQPILDNYCIKCHGPAKTKGNLRLDSLDFAMLGTDDGDEVGRVIVLGSPEESRLYQVVCLPTDAEYFMPPEGKEPLNLEEMRILASWLMDSTDLGNEPDPQASADTARAEADTAADLVQALQGARAAGVNVQPTFQDSEQVTISFANQRGAIDPAAIEAIAPLADTIFELNFAGSGVTDADLGNLPPMLALERLNLKDTAITDAGLENLPAMFNLHYLNLFGTAITDDAMETLEILVVRNEDEETPGKLFLSQTGITLQAVEELRDILGDDVEVIFDDTVGLTPEPNTSDAGQDAQPTVMVNTICPVSGEARSPADPAHTLVHDGQLIGFCCEHCKGKFEQDPTPYLAFLEQ